MPIFLLLEFLIVFSIGTVTAQDYNHHNHTLHAVEFEDKIGSAEKVILDFSSPGCAPCKKVPAILDEVVAELSGESIKAFEIDITENIEIAQKFMVMGVPTVIIFKNGNEINRFNAVPKKEKIIKALK